MLVKFYPHRVPILPEKAKRLSELLQKVIWEAATEEERGEFQELWMGRVRGMLIERKDIDKWLISPSCTP